MDAKGIINYGLGRIGSSRVNSLNPANSKLEKHCKDGYDQWRKSELTKRRWVFARKHVLLGLSPGVTPLGGRTFAFDLPSDCLRPWRDRRTTWIQSGKQIFSYDGKQELEYTADVDEGAFDPLFIDVLGWRVVYESVEYLTQSNTKSADVNERYKDAVKIAGVANAFIIGAEENVAVDELDDWELARIGAWP